MYKKLTEKIKGIDFIELKELKNLNHEVLSTSMALTGFQVENGVDEKIKSLIIDENVQSILKKVISGIRNEGDFHFIDFRGNYNQKLTSFDNEIDQSKKIVFNLQNITNKNTSLITNGRLASQLQDNNSFNTINNVSYTGSLPYKIGKLIGMDLWVDPFMRWDDNFILTIDKVNLEIFDIKEGIDNGPYVAPRVNFDLKLKFDLVNPKCFFVFTDEYQKNSSELISKERDEKINYILGENSGSEQNFEFRIHNNNQLGSGYNNLL